VQAVAGQLTGRDIIPDVAGAGALGDQVGDEGVQLVLRPG